VVTENAYFRLEGDGVPGDAEVVAYEAREEISRPFEVTVDFYTQDASFEVDALLRKPLLLTIVDEKQQTRHFHGVVDRAEFKSVASERFYFRARLVPALTALAFREDCRIFQALSVTDVIQQIFLEAGFGDSVEWQLTGTYMPREFLVQYRETSLAFVSRLMEDEGILYFFRHAPEGHKLIVADTENAFEPMGDAPAVSFGMGQGLPKDVEPLETFTRTRSLRGTSALVRDFDFEKPQVKPEALNQKADAWPIDYFEYPGGFVTGADAKQRALARMRMLRADADVCRGESAALGLRCGVPFSVDGVAEGCLNGDFVVTSLLTHGQQHPESESESFACRNAFRGIPKGAPYASPPRTPRPKIRGIQTVVVTGPSATEDQSIHVDSYGRVKVRFFWDRVGQQDDTASCWLRVSQALMGGSMILPRVGWELSVGFHEGNPDRPFAIGRLYNGEKTPPYGLPGAKASGSIKSQSSPGGAGVNELKMGDSGGTQGFGISAFKDLNITIGHDKTEDIKVDETHNVKVNMSNAVGAKESLKVTGDQSVDVGAILSNKIGGKQSITIGIADTTNADSNYVEHVTGTRSYTVGAMQMTVQNGIEHTVSTNLNRTVGAAHMVASVGSISDNILGNLTETVGAVKVQLAKGSVGETVGGLKSCTAAAGEIHLIKGGYEANCDAAVTRLVGGLHMCKVDGDITIKGQMVTLLGAVGTFKGGSSEVKLGGGPIVIKGSTIAMEGAMVTKVGGTMKLGPG
jgi:type VI secretion system secreted protein VgrG